jgi:Fe-S oxidoreductase
VVGKIFGPEVVQVFNKLKATADPENILNPGKMVNVHPMDENLRFGSQYQARAWEPGIDFSGNGGSLGEKGLIGAVEHCNGAGVCRKTGGVMCPSFQVLQEEEHSTRGRANLLRAMMSGKFPSIEAGEKAVMAALDLCLACKGCKAECPSGVDLAKLKFEFLSRYYRNRLRPARDYLFGYIDRLLSLGAPFSGLMNLLLTSPLLMRNGTKLLGISPERSFPIFARPDFDTLSRRALKPEPGAEPVLVLFDAFNRYFYPENCLAAMDVLVRAGCRPVLLPVLGAGRTLISKGLLEAAKGHVLRVVKTIQQYNPDGQLKIVGVEPSEIYTLRDEYVDLIGDDLGGALEAISKSSFLIDEFLVRPGKDGEKRIMRVAKTARQINGKDNFSRQNRKKQIYLHTHCYQKAQPSSSDGYALGSGATVEMLEAAGYKVVLIDSGCCGMAGSFGYEAAHYTLSMKVGSRDYSPLSVLLVMMP